VLTRRFEAATSKPVMVGSESVHGGSGEMERWSPLPIRNWVCVEEIESASHVLGNARACQLPPSPDGQ
jgi:hypothetical protein